MYPAAGCLVWSGAKVAARFVCSFLSSAGTLPLSVEERGQLFCSFDSRLTTVSSAFLTRNIFVPRWYGCQVPFSSGPKDPEQDQPQEAASVSKYQKMEKGGKDCR